MKLTNPPPSPPQGDTSFLIDSQTVGSSSAMDCLTLIRDKAASLDPLSDRFTQEALTLMREFFDQQRLLIEDRLNKGQRGRKTAEQLCTLIDEIVFLCYVIATEIKYRKPNPTRSERLALVAVGGYGRGTMAPHSDVDLLILLPHKNTDWTETVTETILYLLWDLKLTVGHAVRSVDAALNLAKTDSTIMTTLTETRFLCGDRHLYEDLETRFWNNRTEASSRLFVEQKLAERDERHKRTGHSRYQVEPNIKEGKGGLRDLQSLFWITRYLHPEASDDDLIAMGLFSREDKRRFRRAEDFLLWVRAHMHFIAGRAEERLSFALQQEIASRGVYVLRPGMKPVERFMRRYFMIARDVGNLTRTICAALELREIKQARGFTSLFSGARQNNKTLKDYPGFSLVNGRLAPVNKDHFAASPQAYLTLFRIAQETGHDIHPEALQAIEHGRRLIKQDLRSSKAMNADFLSIATHERNPAPVLRQMNETGFLGAFIPSFARIVAMMQFNMYHHYTVDEHMLLTVDTLARIEHGELNDDHPLSAKIFPSIHHRRALYLAALIHDIAKGRPEDHSIAGARIALKLGPRLGLEAAETETLSWLVRHHLLMSDVSQRRDLSDPRTIRDFADIVQSVERLNLLLVLTVCDIRSVGPGVWNGWKGQLLRNLYIEAEPLLSGGFALVDDDSSQKLFASKMKENHWPDDKIDLYIARHYKPYWRRVPLEKQLAQASLVAAWDQEPDKLHTSVKTDAFQDMTEVLFVTADHNRLLSMIAGACVSVQASIVDAQIFTTRDGVAINSVTLNRSGRTDQDEMARTNQLIDTLNRALRGELRLHDRVFRQRKSKQHRVPFVLEPEVTINNNFSDIFSVVEIKGLDRPGLLYDLMVAFNGLNIRLASAHIATYGERVIDVFYITDLTGKKLYDKHRNETIKTNMMKALLGDDSATNSLKRRA